MYGQNGRIGLLVPSVNTVVEPEFNRMIPEGINVYPGTDAEYAVGCRRF